MGRIIWPTEEDKFEAIGYLAKPGVIDTLEATVPADKLPKFKSEYKGRYSIEFPYVTKAGSKFGYQFRIYLSDTEGCPEFLATQLDEKYKNRINDTHFIAELVKEYGFEFTKKPQNIDLIRSIVRTMGATQIRSFEKGYRVYSDFLCALSKKMNEENLPGCHIIELENSRRTRRRRIASNSDVKSTLTKDQLFKLGWLGEMYVYKRLLERDTSLLEYLDIDLESAYTINWFNQGVSIGEEWEDKSVGQGCDIIISTSNRDLYIEVKSSKRKNGMFTMTSSEMQKMRDYAGKYYLTKVDYLEKLLKNESPEVMVFDMPYERFFKPEKMQEATFRIEGDYQ